MVAAVRPGGRVFKGKRRLSVKEQDEKRDCADVRPGGRVFKGKRRLSVKEQDEKRDCADVICLILEGETGEELTSDEEDELTALALDELAQADEPYREEPQASVDKALDGLRLRKDPLGWLNYQHESRVRAVYFQREGRLPPAQAPSVRRSQWHDVGVLRP